MKVKLHIDKSNVKYMIEHNTKCCHGFINETKSYNYCPVGNFPCPLQKTVYDDEFCRNVTQDDWKKFFDKYF